MLHFLFASHYRLEFASGKGKSREIGEAAKLSGKAARERGEAARQAFAIAFSTAPSAARAHFSAHAILIQCVIRKQGFKTGPQESKRHFILIDLFNRQKERSNAMNYYAIGEIEVTDPTWVPAYLKDVTRMVEARGGRYLVRTSNIVELEGEHKPAQVIVVIEWPSKEAAQAFYESEEYQPYLKSRLAGARNRMLLVAGEDIARSRNAVQ